MQVVATRQELMGALDQSRNRLLERLASKREIQTMQHDIQVLIEATRRHEIENRVIPEVHTHFQREQNVDAQILQRISLLTDRLTQIDNRLARLEQNMTHYKEFLERNYPM